MRTDGIDVAAAAAPLATFAVAGALVGVRGEVRPEVVALALALAVVGSGWWGGRTGGIAAALMAALSFDFMHTKPYLSLKVADSDDLLVTILLLVVGLAVGTLSAEAAHQRRRARARSQPGGVTRVLALTRDATPEDVELAVKAELLTVLGLNDCWFTTEPVELPEIGSMGEIDLEVMRFTHDGFELPDSGVAVPVVAYGHRYGTLVGRPTSGVGVGIEARAAAAALGEVLGLAMRASSSDPYDARVGQAGNKRSRPSDVSGTVEGFDGVI
jgi:hypothetical protein